MNNNSFYYQYSAAIAKHIVDFAKSFPSKEFSSSISTPGWNSATAHALSHSNFESTVTSCEISSEVVRVNRGGLMIWGVENINKACLAAVVELVASDPSVLSVHIGTAPHTLNYDSRGMTQSGNPRYTPYTDAGLTGSGQILAVADTGLDDFSCFLADESRCENTYENCATPRDFGVYHNRDKVIQYIPWADKTDYEGGHGSHVSGSAVGHSIGAQLGVMGVTNDLSHMNGMAPSAKVAFQDIGDEYGYLDVLGQLSLYADLFTQAYTAGARVHTNSWGSSAVEYDYMSYEVDQYTSDHPDFLVLFAAGNDGNMYNIPVVGTPGNAKNCLTVGSGQIRDQYTDQMHGTTTMSYFSSNGPTLDGRLKPG